MKMALDENSENEFHLLHILIPVPDSPNPTQVAQAKSKAKKIVNALKTAKVLRP